jgi:hypothetical protein
MNGTIFGHILVRRGTPTEVALVPHIARLDDDLQSDRERNMGGHRWRPT